MIKTKKNKKNIKFRKTKRLRGGKKTLSPISFIKRIIKDKPYKPKGKSRKIKRQRKKFLSNIKNREQSNFNPNKFSKFDRKLKNYTVDYRYDEDDDYKINAFKDNNFNTELTEEEKIIYDKRGLNKFIIELKDEIKEERKKERNLKNKIKNISNKKIILKEQLNKPKEYLGSSIARNTNSNRLKYVEPASFEHQNKYNSWVNNIKNLQRKKMNNLGNNKRNIEMQLKNTQKHILGLESALNRAKYL